MEIDKMVLISPSETRTKESKIYASILVLLKLLCIMKVK